MSTIETKKFWIRENLSSTSSDDSESEFRRSERLKINRIKIESDDQEDKASQSCSVSPRESTSEGRVSSPEDHSLIEDEAVQLGLKVLNRFDDERTRKQIRAKDRNKPFYVPRNPHFFEHDLRAMDDEEEREDEKKMNKRNERKSKDNVDCWQHDMYDEQQQQPKSNREIIHYYGYDIRLDAPTSTGREDGHLHSCPSNKAEPSEQNPVSSLQIGRGGRSRGYNRRDAPKKGLQSNTRYSQDIAVLLENKLSLEPTIEDSWMSTEKQTVRNSDLLSTGRKGNKSIQLNLPKKQSSYITSEKHFKNGSVHAISHVPKISNHTNGIAFEKTNTTSDYNRNPHSVDKNSNCCRIASDKSLRVHGPPNVRNKLKLSGSFGDLSDEYELLDLTGEESDIGQPSGSQNTVVNGESFSFPDPPNLSATHLMPCASQQHYYMNPYSQQGFSTMMQWGYYCQPYYQSSSSMAIVKQHYVAPWPHTSQTSQVLNIPQHVDVTPYYPLLNNGLRCLIQNTPFPFPSPGLSFP